MAAVTYKRYLLGEYALTPGGPALTALRKDAARLIECDIFGVEPAFIGAGKGALRGDVFQNFDFGPLAARLQDAHAGTFADDAEPLGVGRRAAAEIDVGGCRRAFVAGFDFAGRGFRRPCQVNHGVSGGGDQTRRESL